MAWFDDDRVATAMWLGLGLALIVLMALLSSVLIPFALGGVLAYLLAPGADWLERRHLPRWAASLAMILLTALVLSALVLILVRVFSAGPARCASNCPAGPSACTPTWPPRCPRWSA